MLPLPGPEWQHHSHGFARPAPHHGLSAPSRSMEGCRSRFLRPPAARRHVPSRFLQGMRTSAIRCILAMRSCTYARIHVQNMRVCVHALRCIPRSTRRSRGSAPPSHCMRKILPTSSFVTRMPLTFLTRSSGFRPRTEHNDGWGETSKIKTQIEHVISYQSHQCICHWRRRRSRHNLSRRESQVPAAWAGDPRMTRATRMPSSISPRLSPFGLGCVCQECEAATIEFCDSA